MIEAVEDGIDFIHKVGVFVSEGGLVDGHREEETNKIKIRKNKRQVRGMRSYLLV